MTGRRGRVENGLERELADRPELGAAERSALRAQARAIDVAESGRDSDAVSRANAVYLELRVKAGLTCGAARAADPFVELMAEFTRATTGGGDSPNT